jgi:histidine ammonia-lyase
MADVVIGGESPLTVEDLRRVACEDMRVAIDASAADRMEASRRWVESLFEGDGPGAPVYSINTGFGGLSGQGAYDSREAAVELSRRLILSTASGIGRDLEPEVVRGAMLIASASITKGLTGVPIALVETLVAMLNAGVTPIVPEYGSLGASGDLIPLAHVALVATRPAGDDVEAESGEATYEGRRLSGLEAMRAAGIPRVVLGPKGGLALVAGTGFSTMLATLALLDAELALDSADLAVALTTQAVVGYLDPFLPQVHAARGHVGQIESAARILAALEGSKLVDGGANRDPVRQPPQDAYAIRCAPQVHGAARDVLAFARRTIETEINAVTDNPLIFTELGRDLKAVSSGNFHAEPVAFASDFVAIAATEVASISERRLARLVDPMLNRGLPGMLIASDPPGIDCGFMLPQYLAAGLVSDAKTLSHPDSVDSVTTSANQEDHVSMAMNAGRHARQVSWNAVTVVALELHAAAQAIDLRVREPDRSLDDLSPTTRRAYDAIRRVVDYQSRDEVLHPRVRAVRELVATGVLRA